METSSPHVVGALEEKHPEDSSCCGPLEGSAPRLLSLTVGQDPEGQ